MLTSGLSVSGGLPAPCSLIRYWVIVAVSWGGRVLQVPFKVITKTIILSPVWMFVNYSARFVHLLVLNCPVRCFSE